MSIKDMFETRETQRQYPDQFIQLKATVDVKDLGPSPESMRYDILNGYEISLLLRTRIRCAPLALDGRLPDEFRRIMHELYKDVISHVHHARSAIENGDREQALIAISRAMEEMTAHDQMRGAL